LEREIWFTLGRGLLPGTPGHVRREKTRYDAKLATGWPGGVIFPNLPKKVRTPTAWMSQKVVACRKRRVTGQLGLPERKIPES